MSRACPPVARALRALGVASALVAAGFAAAADAEAPDPSAEFEALQTVLRRYGLDPDPAALSGGLREAVARAVDPDGRVLTVAELEALRAARRGRAPDLGLLLERTPEGQVALAGTIEDSPAARAGLVRGVLLESVGGRYVADRGLDEVVRMLREAETPVQLEVVEPGVSAPRALELSPAVLARPSIATAEAWPRRLAYLRLDGLFDDAAPAVAARLRDWQEEGRFGVILDLRGAGGERIDAAAALAGLLAERPEEYTLAVEAMDGSAVEEFMAVAGERVSMPVMTLIDGRTEGAAELLAALLRASGRGVMLIGAATAGDYGLREGIPVGDDAVLYVRTRRILLDGHEISEVIGGRVRPHLAVEGRARPDDGERAPTPGTGRNRNGREPSPDDRALRLRIRDDAALQRAADILLGLKAMDRFLPGVGAEPTPAAPSDADARRQAVP